jgi:hypothetical protein
LGELKFPPKEYLNGILSYIEEDLEKRISELENLLESVNFKKIEKDTLKKM